MGDRLTGRQGKDTVIYALGDGADSVEDLRRNDEILLPDFHEVAMLVPRDGRNSTVAFLAVEAEAPYALLDAAAITIHGVYDLEIDHLRFG